MPFYEQYLIWKESWKGTVKYLITRGKWHVNITRETTPLCTSCVTKVDYTVVTGRDDEGR